MSEPIYSFVKGIGWTLTPPCEVVIIETIYGNKIKLERRIPNPGEFYSYNWRMTWRMSEWIAYFKVQKSARYNKVFISEASHGENPYGDTEVIDYMVISDVE